MRIRNRSRGIVLIAAFLLGSSHRLQAQDTVSLEERLIAACEAGETSTIESLLSGNRLLIKPIVHGLISESIRAESDGETGKADQKLDAARVIASRFENLFGERSLFTAVGYVAPWSAEQKRQKLAADSLYALGTQRRGAEETRDQALADYDRALSLYREIGDGIGEGSTLGGIGYIWFYRDTDMAIQFNTEALAVRRAVDDLDLVGRSLNTLGQLYYYYLYDYPKAIEFFKEAESVRTEIGDYLGLGSTLSLLADSYSSLGQLDDALAIFQKATTVNKKAGNVKRVAESLLFTGALLHDLGRSSEALAILEQALDYRDRPEARWETGKVLNQLAVINTALGNPRAALENLQKAISMARQIDTYEADLLVGDAYTSMGVIYLEAERRENAKEYFTRAMGKFESLEDQFGISQASINLGETYFELGDHASAETYARKGLEASRRIHDRWMEGVALTLLGNAQVYLNRFEDARVNHEAALTLSRSLNMPSMIFWALLGFAESSERQGDYESAIDYYEQAFETIESTRGGLQTEQDKSGFLSNQRYAYEQVVHFLTKVNVETGEDRYGRLAFHYAERAKARSFLDLLSESMANVREGVNPDLLQRQEDLLLRLSTVRDKLTNEASQKEPDADLLSRYREGLEGLESEYGELQRELRTTNPKYSELRYPQPSGLADVQSRLQDDVVLLEYSVGDSSSTLWAVEKASYGLYMLPNREELKEQVELIRIAFSDPDRSRSHLFAQAGNRLFGLLIEPALDMMDPGDRLVIIPDDVLHYLPFETLLTAPVPGGADYADFPYLILEHAVSYAQSASVLIQLMADRTESAPDDRKQLLAFGDPAFARSEGPSVPGEIATAGLERLPFSREEVVSISRFFRTEETMVLLGEEATEGRLKAADSIGQFRYIHLATHGLINESKPDFSSVVLAGDTDPPEDGFLQAVEIFNLKLDADLVVLSACETGLGRMVRGEGLVGLTRAFMYAGAPSMVVSLWSVADLSTSRLMEHFYENLIVEQQIKTEALRTAKLKMIEEAQFAHPFYWAPFVMIGDWK